MPDLGTRILVTGAAGHLGHRVAELLLEAGASGVTAGSRQLQKLDDLAARGAHLVRADFDDPASLDSAFAGIERLLIVSTDAVTVPGQRQQQHLAAIAAAIKAKVRLIVYTSMPKPEPGSPIPFAPDHYATEQAIERSGIPFTILRVNWYADNSFRWLPQVLQSGQWFTSAGDGGARYVAREDVARIAAAALLSGAAQGRIDVAGPDRLTAAQIVATVNEVFGTQVALVPVSDTQLAAGLSAAGVPPPLVQLLVAMDTNTRTGGLDVESDAVRRLTGRSPQSFRDFLIQNRAAYIASK